ncbi:FkbM family methyltransferase [Rhodobacteraceae bacterium RKSG542]|uniref:FkbM family methyltransferase n=1 Tax=Pseudovibrio flavus TaxID=2529854 RepID=UPI0012BC186C|nr:FkbM family methyltransferase [Pseudovibrio flavus]MTI17627.1 FkbM family methyltransferase [Pseudovibrio flavus]
MGFLEKTKLRIAKYYKIYVLKDPFLVAHRRWKKDRGDVTLRLDYDLSKDSVVFDIGGYHGDFASAIYERYGCKVYVFEPSKAFYDLCEKRFEENPNIVCFNYGLSDADGEFDLSDEGDGSSVVSSSKGGDAEKVRVRSISSVYEELGSPKIALMKINIEGGEYSLLPQLIQDEIVPSIDHLQIQFHEFIEGAHKLRSSIQQCLGRTHRCTWNYEFVWENWQRNC